MVEVEAPSIVDVDVKDDWQEPTKKFEVSEEEYNKLKEVEKNKTIALRQEREEAKTMKSELDEFRKLKQEEAEKELKKKGKYEELLTEKEEKLLTYEKELETLRELKEAIDTKTSEKVETLMKSIPNEEIEFINTVLEWKDKQTQVSLLEKFVDKFKKPEFSDENADKKWKQIDEGDKTDLDWVLGVMMKWFL